MLIPQKVEVRVNSYNANYYQDLGYEIPMKKASRSTRQRYKKDFVYDFNKTLMVDVEDLPLNSDYEVDVLCDFCQSPNRVRYADYHQSLKKTGNYVCQQCMYRKIMQTNLSRYGEFYVQTEEFKEKRAKACVAKYGPTSPLQNEEIKQKVRATNLEKYGYEVVSQVPEFKEKARQTTLEHYGVEHVSQCEEIKEKVRTTNLQRYGVPYTQQLPEVRAKVNETLCKNGTQKTSKQQLYLHSLLGGEINYPISYYAVDICFPEEKVYLEYSGGGHDLRVILGRLTQDEFNQKEIIRNNVLKKEGYRKIEIISKKDYLPCDEILFQMLTEAKYYFTTTFHTWVTYDIDQSLMRNAEHKDGIPYSYGELRTIKNNDIQTAQAV